MSNNSHQNYFRKLFSFILLVSILSGAFTVTAQTRRRPTRRSPNPKQTAKIPVEKTDKACNGGWSGVVNFEETLDDSGSSDEPGIRKGKDRIIQKWSHNVSYTGKIVVDGSDPRNVAASGTVEFSDVRRQHGIEKVWDSCGAWKPEHWFIIDGKHEQIETGDGGGATDFFLNSNELAGTYNFSFRFPKVPGKYSLEDHTKREGHCQPKNNEPIDISEKKDSVIEGKTGRVENQKIDPKNPNVLAGSVTIDKNDYNNPKRVKTPITKISWKFRRCSPPLMITDVKFFQPLFPSPNSWIEIKENEHAIDGNQVKIIARVANLSSAQKTASVNFKELKENMDLPEGKIGVNFQPREEREIEYVWDTSGFAWKEANVWNQPEIRRQIEVRVPDDVNVKDIQVNPKPVILIPGLWSESQAFGRALNYFQNLPNTDWAVDFVPIQISQNAAANAPIVDKTVREMQKKENAWHVDLVAHSSGGLIGRSYVANQMPTQFDGRPTATHLVMVGTPNMGTPCSSGLDNIVTRFFKRQADSFLEISVKNMREFNRAVTLRNGTKFSALVGNAFAPICQMDSPGDGITPNASAIWTLKDWKFSTVRTRHEEMIGDDANLLQIYKWLAIPPKGDHAPDKTSAALEDFSNEFSSDANIGKTRNYGAMFATAAFEKNQPNIGGGDEPTFSTGVRLAAGETKEIEIPVLNGSKMSLVFLAPANVSATLLDEKGEIVGKNAAGGTDAAMTFRTITVKKPFANGTWKLKLESREQNESEIALAAFVDFNSAIFDEK
jgi:triacylglycerol esterase/lipase EstA (alpha/beta hydrolase family)